MTENDTLLSIGNVLVAIDEKLALLIEAKETAEEGKTNEIKALFDQLAEVVSARITGDLPRAIEFLEKKIEIFDLDIKEGLKSFSTTLIDYENKLEERIREELQLLAEQVKVQLDNRQREQTERLEMIFTGISSLGDAVMKLSNSLNEFNKNRPDQALVKRLEEILVREAEEKKNKGGFFSKRK